MVNVIISTYCGVMGAGRTIVLLIRGATVQIGLTMLEPVKLFERSSEVLRW